MVRNTYMSSTLLYRSKLTLIHTTSKMVGICEIKIWKINDSKSYPLGLKYSLFCVESASGKIIVGFDNHFPKGPHKHIGEIEEPYHYVNDDLLVEDFWREVGIRGFIL